MIFHTKNSLAVKEDAKSKVELISKVRMKITGNNKS